LVCGLLSLSGGLHLETYNLSLRRDELLIFAVCGVGLLMLAIMSTGNFSLYIGDIKEVEERERAEEEVRELQDPYSSLELAQKRLNEYYAINQSQARGSFRWAVFAMFVGLSTIVAGIWIFYLGDTPSTFLTSLSTAAGIVVNVISGLYLYLHNRTQKRALYYYNQLVRLQNLGLSIRLAESHTDENQKTDAKNRVINEILSVIKTTAIQESKAITTEK
jgi:hypothetical protein